MGSPAEEMINKLKDTAVDFCPSWSTQRKKKTEKNPQISSACGGGKGKTKARIMIENFQIWWKL